MPQRIEFTIENSATVSNWVSVGHLGPLRTKLLALYTPTGTPSTTAAFMVRDPNSAAEYPVKKTDGTAFSITVDGLGVYGADVLAGLSSLIEDRQWRLTLGTSNSSGAAIKLFLEVS